MGRKMSVCACLYMDIPQEIRLWGEKHLELDNPYRMIGDLMFDFIPQDELTSMYSNRCRPSVNPIILSFVQVKGLIGEVGLFNKALGEEDIRDIMTNGLKAVADVSLKGKLTKTWGNIKKGIAVE